MINFFKLLMYISLFPQLIAGPIVRYETIEREVSERKTTLSDFSDGLTRFIVGLAKKAINCLRCFIRRIDFYQYNTHFYLQG